MSEPMEEVVESANVLVEEPTAVEEVSTEENPQVDNNNGGKKDTEEDAVEDMETETTASNDVSEADGKEMVKSTDDASEKDDAPKEADPSVVADASPEDEGAQVYEGAQVDKGAQEDEGSLAEDAAEDVADAEADSALGTPQEDDHENPLADVAADGDGSEDNGASNFTVATPDGTPSPGRGRGKGRLGRPRGRGKGRWSLSPRSKLKSSPKARSRGRGQSLIQSDFVFPDASADAPEIKKAGINVIDKPELLKPFELGWFREHVLRGSSQEDHEAGRKASDVYYFTPVPIRKKVRSMVEISDFLILHEIKDLNSNNFSFARCTIYKTPFDISRFTFKGRNDSPKVRKPKKPAGQGSPLVVKLPVPKGPAAPKGPAPKLSVGNQPDLADKGFKVVQVENPGSDVKTLKIIRPVVKAVAKKRTGGKIKRASDVAAAGPSAKKPSLMAGYNPRLCGMECPGKQGHPPELHCKMCMCLFHADCVGHLGSESDFTCPECTRINDLSGSSEQVNGSGLPPLRLGTVLRHAVPGNNNRQPPTLMRISPVPEPLRPKINVVGTFNVRPPPAITAVSSHVITLPPSVVGKIKLDAPLTLKTDGKDLVIPPSCMIATPTGMKVFLPPGVLSSAGVEPGLARAINILPNPSNPQTMSVVSTTTGATPKPIDVPVVKILDRKKVKVMTREYPGINPAACFMQKVNAGLICCRRIFQFLTVQERLRAAQVCQTWKDILSHPIFWNKVRLRDSTVMDWEKAAIYLRDNNTKTLDMRGLQHPNNDKNRTWHQFTGVLSKMTQLQEIHFDQCPVQILHSVAEKLNGLRSLSAQFVMDAVLPEAQLWSTNAKLDFDKFKGMDELDELTIRGACGLVLVNSLHSLSSLKKLKSLSLATLKQVKDDEFKFLESLVLLEELEIGDCDGMEEQGFKQLENLAKLKRLRLEGRPEARSSIPQLGQSLQVLKNLTALELIKFSLNEEILKHLKTLKLKQLTLWPEKGSKAADINSAICKMVHEMPTLESFEWAIMGDQIGENNDNPQNYHQNESILMLKDEGEGARVANIREISERLFTALPKARIRIFRIGVPVMSE